MHTEQMIIKWTKKKILITTNELVQKYVLQRNKNDIKALTFFIIWHNFNALQDAGHQNKFGS
jgi:hypothetical protein